MAHVDFGVKALEGRQWVVYLLARAEEPSLSPVLTQRRY